MQSRYVYFAVFPALCSFAFVLVACSKDTRQADIKQCIAQVQKQADQGALPQLNLSQSDSTEVRHDKIGSAVADCMSKAGYRHGDGDMSDERCIDDVDFNAYCYRPDGQ